MGDHSMRSRKEILRDHAKDPTRIFKLQLDVLLDIRDLLTPKPKKTREKKQKTWDCDRLTEANKVLDFLNVRAGKNFRKMSGGTPSLAVQHIYKRLGQGYTKQQLNAMIANRVRAWGGDERMEQYLRPDTLFAHDSKFESYMGEVGE